MFFFHLQRDGFEYNLVHGLSPHYWRTSLPSNATSRNAAATFHAVAPYVAMSLILLAPVFFVPNVAMWLPALIG
jgi:hypothetical protein